MDSTSARSLFRLQDAKRIGIALAFVLCGLLFVFAFAVHPGLASPHRLSVAELILRAHGNRLLAIGHALVLMDAALLIVVTIELMRLLGGTSGMWWGFSGAVLTVAGAVALAAEKGAECLTMSALDTLPEAQFNQAMPALLAIFEHKGWMILVTGVFLLAIGLTLQSIGLLIAGSIPRWQSALLLGVWLMGFPDGWELVALLGSIMITLALVPHGVALLQARRPQAGEPPIRAHGMAG